MSSDRLVPEHTLRPAMLDDLDQILAVHLASREAAYRGRLPDDAMDHQSVEERRNRWYGRLTGDDPQGATLVVEIDGRIVGFCRSESENSDPTGRSRQIHLLYVAPDFQGYGLGQVLLEGMTATIAASGCNRATLGVFTFSEEAIGYYEHLGWVRFGSTEMPGPAGTLIRSYLYEKDLMTPDSDPVRPE